MSGAPSADSRVRAAEEQIDEGYVRRNAAKVGEDDFKKVVDRADEIRGKFAPDGPLGRFKTDAELLVGVVKDYWAGDYREMPYLSIAAVAFALLYVLNPVDLIPDFIPVIGVMDDAAVVGVCLMMIEQDLHNYRAWKEARPG